MSHPFGLFCLSCCCLNEFPNSRAHTQALSVVGSHFRSSMASRPIPGVESPKQPAVRVRLCVCQRIGHAHTAQRGAPNRLFPVMIERVIKPWVSYQSWTTCL